MKGLPRHWSHTKVKYLASYLNGYPFAPADWSDEGKPIIRIQNLTDQEAAWNRTTTEVPARYCVEAGDILIAWSASLGVHVWEKETALLNQHIYKVSPVDSVHRGFYLWAAKWFIEELQSQVHGSTMQHLTKDVFGGFSVPLPPPAEQEHIANFLDEQMARIDALIAEKERLESSLKDIEEVTAFDLVVRGLRADAERKKFREPWLSDVPAHWELSKLRHIATVGNGSTPKRDNAAFWEGGTLPWLNSGSVNASRITEASDYVTRTAKQECHLPVVRTGSTVVALTGQGKTRGTASIVDFETTLNQHLAYISLFDGRMTDEYLCVVLTGMYSVLRHISDDAGSTKGALTCEQLNQFRVPIPPAKEQAAIVEAYRARTQAINELRAHAKLHIDRLREYRSSLISAAVTGQLDVNSCKEAA